jgi:hypothetical protein
MSQYCALLLLALCVRVGCVLDSEPVVVLEEPRIPGQDMEGLFGCGLIFFAVFYAYEPLDYHPLMPL